MKPSIQKISYFSHIELVSWFYTPRCSCFLIFPVIIRRKKVWIMGPR